MFLSQNSHQKLHLFLFSFKNLEARSNYTPRTIKVLKGALLSGIDKHEEKSKQKTITLGLCETLIHLSFVST
jgi:hypothetical protein